MVHHQLLHCLAENLPVFLKGVVAQVLEFHHNRSRRRRRRRGRRPVVPNGFQKSPHRGGWNHPVSGSQEYQHFRFGELQDTPKQNNVVVQLVFSGQSLRPGKPQQALLPATPNRRPGVPQHVAVLRNGVCAGISPGKGQSFPPGVWRANEPAQDVASGGAQHGPADGGSELVGQQRRRRRRRLLLHLQRLLFLAAQQPECRRGQNDQLGCFAR
mmetsp:Transcript_21896/g.47643  ORF Transcript_21896/g.47643 Transcript_21896/m.47643 type:complete len:213 (+) Transcript_21896:158-796(+)